MAQLGLTKVNNAERILIYIKNGVWADLRFDVYFTNYRMAAIYTSKVATPNAGFAAGGFVGALIGAGIDHLMESRWKEKANMEGLSLDEKLLLDKRSLSVPYGEINKLEVMKSRFGGRRFLVNGNTSEQHGFGIEKPEDYENLCVLLPQIPALVGKLEFSGK